MNRSQQDDDGTFSTRPSLPPERNRLSSERPLHHLRPLRRVHFPVQWQLQIRRQPFALDSSTRTSTAKCRLRGRAAEESFAFNGWYCVDLRGTCCVCCLPFQECYITWCRVKHGHPGLKKPRVCVNLRWFCDSAHAQSRPTLNTRLWRHNTLNKHEYINI